MARLTIPAVFMRGGTSKALMFHAHDLPVDKSEWEALFTAAMGSPDRYGRQLDGMGGGGSSLSKVCVISASKREDADVDYTFAQVMVGENRVDYGANCGNMSSAVGPFAVDERLVAAAGDEAVVRIFNTNTGKVIRSTFALDEGTARYDGSFAIPGVDGGGSPIRLDFLDPGGATTGRLLPTGNVVDRLEVPGFGRIEASLVDAANAVVFVRAADIGLTGREQPDQIEADASLLHLLDAIRLQASVTMGIASDVESASRIRTVPFVAFVSPPDEARTLDGEVVRAADVDLTVRAMSSGQPHRALPLTVSLCAAVAARITGTTISEALRGAPAGGPLRLGMPSGVLTVGADVTRLEGRWVAQSGSFYRTARRLFDGQVWIPNRTGCPARPRGV